MEGLSIFFALLSLLSLLALPVALIRPRWLKVETRLTAVFACLYAFAGSAGIGMLIDPESDSGVEDAAALILGLGVWHMIALGIRWWYRKTRDPIFQASVHKRLDRFEEKGKATIKKAEDYAKAKSAAIEQKLQAEKQRTSRRPVDNPDAINPEKLAEFEESLTTIWAGTTKTIEFTYEKPFGDRRSRRRVDVEELMYDSKSRLVIRGYCHEKGEERTFRESRIRTKIKCGSKRYDFDEWCVELLDVYLHEVVPDY